MFNKEETFKLLDMLFSPDDANVAVAIAIIEGAEEQYCLKHLLQATYEACLNHPMTKEQFEALCSVQKFKAGLLFLNSFGNMPYMYINHYYTENGQEIMEKIAIRLRPDSYKITGSEKFLASC